MAPPYAENNGSLTIKGAVTGAGTATINAGVLEVDGAFGQSVTFAASAKAETLVLGDSTAYGGTISGFSHSGTTRLDLRDIGFVSASQASWNQGTGVLTVTGASGHVALIHLAGSFANGTSDFACSNDGHGGSFVIDPRPPTPLATPGG